MDLDKGYLDELETVGVPVVPTVKVEAGARVELAGIARERGWPRLVVKPAISASSWRTVAVDTHDAAPLSAGQEALDALSARRVVLVQPYVQGVDRWGEIGHYIVDGRLTVTIERGAVLAGRRDDALCTARGRPEAGEYAEASHTAVAAVAARHGVPHYARVDVVVGETGPHVLEVELIDPAIRFSVSPATLAAFVALIAR